jgi:outer membrane lipoprotein-sorting protein
MRRLALGALLVTLAACAPRQAIPPQPEPAGPLPSEAALVGSLRARRQSIHSLRAMAKTRYTTPSESRGARQLIIAARPDRLRLEILSPFGVAFVLTTDAGLLAAYARDEATFYHGAATAENLSRYTQVGMPVDVAVDLILGTPPFSDGGSGVVSWENGQVKLSQKVGRRVHVTWFTGTLEPARYEQRDEKGTVLIRATFADFAEIAALRVPTRLSLDLPSSRQRLEIAFRDPELNPSLPDSLFALATPSGSTVVDLDRTLH